MKRPHCFFARETVRPHLRPKGVGVDPCSAAPVLPLCPSQTAGKRESDQLLALLKSLLGKEDVRIQVDGLIRRGKLISVDPVLLVSGEGKVCFLRLAAIKAVDF